MAIAYIKWLMRSNLMLTSCLTVSLSLSSTDLSRSQLHTFASATQPGMDCLLPWHDFLQASPSMPHTWVVNYSPLGTPTHP